MNSLLVKNCIQCKNHIVDNHGNSRCSLFRLLKPSYIPFYETDLNKIKNIKIKDDNSRNVSDYIEISIARFDDFDLCGSNAKYYVESNIDK